MTADLRIRFAVDDEVLARLHTDAFGGDHVPSPWKARLERHSRSWVGAFVGDRLVVIADGVRRHRTRAVTASDGGGFMRRRATPW
ncbi:hypothetical protein [Nocardia asiatica]|uniref:hypothetical protein n=1 Tax=Nocardia asiatica TaxID=209252 RepID=UPI0024543BF1|nr:hypothetical protein [Nocardia asiatica]